MLLLAGMDRLDTELTVGQMQGKFQLTVLPQAGHACHEDQPTKVGFNFLYVKLWRRFLGQGLLR